MYSTKPKVSYISWPNDRMVGQGRLPHEDVELKEKRKENVMISHASSDDIGPQRLCPECYNSLAMHHVPEAGTYTLFMSDYGRAFNVKDEANRLTDLKASNRDAFGHSTEPEYWYCATHGYVEPIYQRPVKLKPKEARNTLNRCMTLDDAKRKYIGITSSAADWFRDNKELLADLYVTCADDAGNENVDHIDIRETPGYYDDEGAWVEKEVDAEVIYDRMWESPISTYDTRRLTAEERYVETYVSKWLLKSHMGCITRINKKKGKIREDIYNTLMDLAQHVRRNHIWHPKAERHYRYKDLQSEAQIMEVVEVEEAAIARAKVETEAFMHQDWELESRAQELQIVIC